MITKVNIHKTNLKEGTIAKATVKFDNGLILTGIGILASGTVEKTDAILFASADDREDYNEAILAAYHTAA